MKLLPLVSLEISGFFFFDLQMTDITGFNTHGEEYLHIRPYTSMLINYLKFDFLPPSLSYLVTLLIGITFIQTDFKSRNILLKLLAVIS